MIYYAVKYLNVMRRVILLTIVWPAENYLQEE